MGPSKQVARRDYCAACRHSVGAARGVGDWRHRHGDRGAESGCLRRLAVGDCLTAGGEPSTVACDDADAATRITEVFDDEYTAGTLAELSCPEGSSIVEQRSVLDDEDDSAEAAACVESLP